MGVRIARISASSFPVSIMYSDSDPWGFKVIEETPLSYKTDGGILHTVICCRCSCCACGWI